MTRSVRRWALLLTSGGLGLLVVLPLLAGGFVLAYDMVFVPKPHFSRELLGAGGTLPRAVPIALVVTALSRVLTGEVVQGLVLVAIFAGAAYGAGRLVPTRRTAPRIAAAVLFAWNPLTYERLLLGQWALLLGYALIPWAVLAGLSYRRNDPQGTWWLALALIGAMIASPYTGVLAAAMAIPVALWPPHDPALTPRRAGTAVAIAVVANLPWLVPLLLHEGAPQDAELAMRLFRSRPDSPLGLLGSLLSLGGLWRPDLAPPGRSSVAWVPAFVIIVVVAVAGWPVLGRRWPRGARAGLLFVSVAGVVIAAAPSTLGLRTLSSWLVALPGGAFFRDSQKFVVPLAVLLAVTFGLGVERVVTRAGSSSRRLRTAAAVSLCILPVALAPSLAWAAAGRLSPVSYPESWSRAEEVMATDPAPGGALALPWHAYLSFAWNHGRTVHQPAPVFFTRRVVADTGLEVGAYELPAEDPWSRHVAPLVTGGGSLADGLPKQGIRYVLLFKEADWTGFAERLTGAEVVFDAPDLRLYRLAGPISEPNLPMVPLGPVLVGDAITLGLATIALVSLARSRGTRAAS